MVADAKGLLAMDESIATCNKRFEKVEIPQTEEARAWRIQCRDGKDMSIKTSIRHARNLRHSKDRRIPIMEPNADKPKVLESKPESELNAKSGLKSLPLLEVGYDQRRQSGVDQADARANVHYANGPK